MICRQGAFSGKLQGTGKRFLDFDLHVCTQECPYFMRRFLTTGLTIGFLAGQSYAAPGPEDCLQQLKRLPIMPPKIELENLCKHAQLQTQCVSNQGRPIFHFDFSGEKSQSSILVFALTHGDERESGTIALRWMQRLNELKPRNRWRIVPVLNPDGLEAKTRVNANGVDINRNFPSKDWEKEAIANWEKHGKKDPRKNPGLKAASEKETLCAMDQITEFRPDFIVSVHTPYGVLDFDGPKVTFPDFKHLPWVSLGTYSGSLGRYMWKDQNVPVLTIELKDEKLLSEMDQVDLLQDISGTIAIRAAKKSNQQPN